MIVGVGDRVTSPTKSAIDDEPHGASCKRSTILSGPRPNRGAHAGVGRRSPRRRLVLDVHQPRRRWPAARVRDHQRHQDRPGPAGPRPRRRDGVGERRRASRPLRLASVDCRAVEHQVARPRGAPARPPRTASTIRCRACAWVRRRSPPRLPRARVVRFSQPLRGARPRHRAPNYRDGVLLDVIGSLHGVPLTSAAAWQDSATRSIVDHTSTCSSVNILNQPLKASMTPEPLQIFILRPVATTLPDEPPRFLLTGIITSLLPSQPCRRSTTRRSRS